MVACATKPVFFVAGETAVSAGENVSFPAEGRTNCAAMRSSVVLPEPFRPANATHSPGAISSDTRRNAYSPPYLLSIFSNRRPMRRASGGVTMRPRARTPRTACSRSASHQFAQYLFRARTLLRILRFAYRAGLPSQFQPKQLILQRFQAGAHRGVDLPKRRGSRNGIRGRMRRRHIA